jgi:hypothetical protein
MLEAIQMQYYQVFIAAEQRAQGMRLLDALIAKQLILGGPILNGPAKFLWNFADSSVPENLRQNELLTVEQDYCYVVSYTREDLKQQLVEEAEKASLEEICMISFLPMEGNAALIKLLESTFAGRETATEEPKPIDAVAALTFVKSSDIPSRTQSSFS